jgi:hypothetical protein
MTKEDLYSYVINSRMFQQWHWLSWHFQNRGHPLAESILEACLECEAAIPGFAYNFIDNIASISGHEKYLPHWEQLLQRIAELHVIKQLVSYKWGSGTSFELEPSSTESKKNPEIMIKTREMRIGFEVKTPALFAHQQQRSNNMTQLVSRILPKEELKRLPDSDKGMTLPRDNPIKDFLDNADEKFRGFKLVGSNFFGILVIVWDDFIYEPLSALVHPDCGLFTAKSFAKNAMGSALNFECVDGVIVIRHLHQLVRACRDETLLDGCRHPLDYGRLEEFPFKAFLQNPWGKTVPDAVLDCLQAYEPNHLLGSEYVPKDIVWWF